MARDTPRRVIRAETVRPGLQRAAEADDSPGSGPEADGDAGDPAPGAVPVREQDESAAATRAQRGTAQERDTVEAAGGSGEMPEDVRPEHHRAAAAGGEREREAVEVVEAGADAGRAARRPQRQPIALHHELLSIFITIIIIAVDFIGDVCFFFPV